MDTSIKESKTILVIGATGMLGKPVAKQLLKDGFHVRVLARNPQKAQQILGDGFEICAGDVTDSLSLRAALKDVDGVHISLKGGPSEADFERMDLTRRAILLNLQRKAVQSVSLSSPPMPNAGFARSGKNAWIIFSLSVLLTCGASCLNSRNTTTFLAPIKGSSSRCLYPPRHQSTLALFDVAKCSVGSSTITIVHRIVMFQPPSLEVFNPYGCYLSDSSIRTRFVSE